jgi:hypothetical protein
MTPDAAWPNLPAYQREFTPEQHAAHRSPRGVPRPEDLAPRTTTVKAAKGLMKFARKPHLKLAKTAKTRKRKREKAATAR